MLGKDQPISLHLVDIPVMVNALKVIIFKIFFFIIFYKFC